MRQPPEKIAGILRMLGPGLIMAGGIVGSGELIAATHTGAKAGFVFSGNYFRLCDQMLHAGRNGASRHSQRRNTLDC